MASAGQILAGRVGVIIGGDAGPLTQALNTAKASVDAFAKRSARIGAGLVGAGAGILAPLGAAAMEFAKAGDDAAKMSRRTGVAVESLGRLGHAATLSGADVGTLEKGLRGMSRGIYDAQQGVGEALPVLTSLGVNIDSLSQMNPEEQFLTIADAIGGITDPTTKTASAMKVFGRAGSQLIPLMDAGGEAIRGMGDEAERLNVVFSAEGAAAAERLTDDYTNLQTSLKGVVYQVGEALAPALSGLLKTVTDYVAIAGAWIKDNKELVVTVAAVGAVLAGAGAVFLGLATAATVLSGVIAGITLVFTPLGAILGGIAVGALYLSGAFDNVGETASNLLKWIGNIRVAGLRLNTRFEEWKLGWADVFDSAYEAGVRMYRGLLVMAKQLIDAYKEQAEAVVRTALVARDAAEEVRIRAKFLKADTPEEKAEVQGMADTLAWQREQDAKAIVGGISNTLGEGIAGADETLRGIKQRKDDRQVERIRNRIQDQVGDDSDLAEAYEAVGIKLPDLPTAEDLANIGKPTGAAGVPGVQGMPQAATPAEVLGTFSARGAAGLTGGGNRIEKQQLDVQRRMADSLSRIAENTEGEPGSVLA